MNTCVLILASAILGDLNIYTVRPSTSSQITPAVSGEWVVWTDKTNDDIGNIFAKNIQTDELVSVCEVGNEQSIPAISGDKIVWQDKRGTTTDIYMYDLSLRQETGISVRSGKQELPAICGNIIVWQDNRNGTANPDIYGWDLSTGTPIEIPRAGSQTEPAVDASIGVCLDTTTSDVSMMTLPSGPVTNIPHTGTKNHVAISGNVIVWDELGTDGSSDILSYRIGDSQPVNVASGIANQSCPAINGHWVVWQQEMAGIWGIYGKNIVSGDECTVYSGQSAPQRFPAISGDLVVWQSGADDAGVILAAYIPPPTIPTTVTVSYPEDANVFRSGKTAHIDWQTSGAAIEKVKIEITPDGTNWNLVADDANNTGAYIWTPAAKLNSNRCQIRISAGTGQGLSAGFFTVYDCPASMTADLTGDCKVNLRDFAEFSRQWLDCGNQLVCGNL